MVAEFSGALMLALLALLTREAWPTPSILWGAAGAGLVGVVGLAALYTGLGRGQMGIVAPLSAVIAGSVPVLAGLLYHGLPSPLQMVGFAVALAAVWLLAGSGDLRANGAQLTLAVIAGLGFGFYFVLVEMVSREDVYWALAVARTVAGLALALLLLVQRRPLLPERKALPLATVAGLFDAGGNLFFALAAQAGRIDIAGVLASLYPGTTVLLARVILHERLTRAQAVGVAAALLAVALIAA